MRKTAFIPALVWLSVAAAAPPGEVPADAAFGTDKRTFSWSAPSGGADTYDVYRGSAPAAYDQQCRVLRTPDTNTALAELPAAGDLFYYLVAAVNGDGAGSLGTDSSGAPIPNGSPCADLDGDLVADNLDNCPAAENFGQADQDGNGVGDPCDPNTYDFESDAIGQRPAGMLQFGSAVPFTVQDFAGDHGVAYATTSSNVTDRFERVLAGMPQQDVTVYLDFDDAPETCALELWSDGAASWNAGTGLVLEVGPARGLTLYSRLNAVYTATVGPAAPANGRLRLRLIKGAGTTSELHVDTFDGTDFVPDLVVFDVLDDHRHRGLGAALASRGSGKRGVKRATIVHDIPAGPLTLRQHPSWSSDWKIFQRDGSGHAEVPVKFFYRQEEVGRAQARVVETGTSIVLPGHDFTDHEVLLPATTGAAGELALAGVPAGGNYDVELRLVRDADGAVLAQTALVEIAVGDVFVASGQSNMSGRGAFSGGEQRSSLVHLFHNNGTWKQGEEPMDGKADQTDNVSLDSTAAHSLMLRFAKDLRAAIGVPVGVIPAPRSATNLQIQWQRDESDRDNRSTLYGSQLYRAQLQSYPVPLRGFLWYQGESDLGRTVAQYKADLQTFIAKVREDLGDPALPFLVAQLATYDGQLLENRLAIQEAQRQVVAEDPDTALVTTVDQPRGDVVHLLAAGYREVGVRFANAARQLVYDQPITPLLTLVEARRTVGATAVELVYDGSVTGGTSALFAATDTAGALSVTSVTTSGSILTLGLNRPLQGAATVSYGYSNLPTDAWVEDAQGVPVACFFELAVAP